MILSTLWLDTLSKGCLYCATLRAYLIRKDDMLCYCDQQQGNYVVIVLIRWKVWTFFLRNNLCKWQHMLQEQTRTVETTFYNVRYLLQRMYNVDDLFSLMFIKTNGWTNNGLASDFGRHHAHVKSLSNVTWTRIYHGMCPCIQHDAISLQLIIESLQWRHNERGCVSNHQRLDCLLNGWFRRRSKWILGQ